MSFPRVLLGLTLIVALAACGGGKSQSTNSDTSTGAGTTGTPAPPLNQTTPDGGAPAGNGGSMAGAAVGSAAAVPANLNCGTAQPVWVNQRSHVYHLPSDPLYGRTKHGAYMCPDAATAAGYRPAGSGHYQGGGHHRHGAMNAGGADMSSPDPAAT